MKQLLGVTVFSIDPYQIGYENEEGIASGAFWFYRKLGFRPVRPELLKLTLSEERKMAKNPQHRTSAATLRRLAAGHMLFDGSGSRNGAREWDRFQVRHIGLAVQRRMAREFNGNAEQIRAASSEFVCRALEVKRPRNEISERTFADLALVIAMIPALPRWTREDKEQASSVILAKIAPDEAIYLKKMQKHASLRASFIQLGSKR